MKTRGRQRLNRINKKREQHMRREIKEELIKLHDKCGIKDPTPYEAVRNMIYGHDEMEAG